MDGPQSEIIAIRSVEWLASDENEFRGFLALTGTSLDSTRSRLGDPDFLAAALDYILSSEKRLLAFCEDARIAPEAPLEARQFLPGGDAPHWT